jgi:hypothetical protein
MATATERLLVRIDATTEQLRREMKAADKAVGNTANAVERSLKRIKKSFDGLRTSLNRMGAIIGGVGLAAAPHRVRLDGQRKNLQKPQQGYRK